MRVAIVPQLCNEAQTGQILLSERNQEAEEEIRRRKVERQEPSLTYASRYTSKTFGETR